MSVSVFGIRHHGPGSARALGRALDELAPDIVLVEGPPEADPLVALAAAEQLTPPVALLAYAAGNVSRASFWPFATFSPEWTAIRYAVGHDIPLRFCDLPAGYRFGQETADESTVEQTRPVDPLGQLAEAAGYDDAERWWDDVIEHRRDDVPPFAAIAEAMAAVRAENEPDGGGDLPVDSDAVREAYMRTVLRAAMKEGYSRIAVVCGAWHVPAFAEPLPPAARDAAQLRGRRKVPVEVTWVPWTHGRLASWRGYGAGVTSPGWYHHLFTTEHRVIEKWMVHAAGVLREHDLPISSAHVIESVRLAETLATLRGRPLAGLAEVTESIRAVLCDGDDLRLELIQRHLVVGERLGTVPDETPSVPLMRDLAATQKRLRLAPEALSRDLDLDLRKENDLARSQLLHRLRLLGVAWGEPQESRRGKGTFWESWQLAWAPELAVDLIAASAYGTTIPRAATAKAVEVARTAPDLATITGLVEQCLVADLPDALGPVLRALDERVALDVDVAHLMDALPALARSLRYGNVRGTDTGTLGGVVEGLVLRACIGLPAALSNLDDQAAVSMRDRINATHTAVRLIADGDQPGGSGVGVDAGVGALSDQWLATLTGLAGRDSLHGLVAGRINRLLYDSRRLAEGEIGLRMARTLSVGVVAGQAAAWVEGFLAGGGLLLVHDEQLLRLVDEWLTQIPGDTFTEVLPLLRRTFATFAAPERRAIGDQIRQYGSAGPRASTIASADDFDPDLAALAVPTLAVLLGYQSAQTLEVTGA